MFANMLQSAFRRKYPMGGGKGGPTDWFVNDPNQILNSLGQTNFSQNPVTFNEAGRNAFGDNWYVDQPQNQTGTATIQPQPTTGPQLYNVGETARPSGTPFTQQPIAQKKVDFGKSVFKGGKYSKSNAAKELGISKSELSRRAKEKGFKSTEEYYKWYMNNKNKGSAAPTQTASNTPRYMDESAFTGFLDTIRNAFRVQPVYAQTNDMDLTGSGVNMGNQQLQLGNQAETRGGNWLGGLLPERGWTEYWGTRLGFNPNYGSVANAYGQGTATALQNMAQSDRDAILTNASYAQPTMNFGDLGDVSMANLDVGSNMPATSLTTATTGSTAPAVSEQGEILGDQSTVPPATAPAEAPATAPTVQSEYGGLLDGLDTQGTAEGLIGQLEPIYDDLETQLQTDKDADIANLEAQYDYLQRNYANMDAQAQAEADLAMKKIKETLDYGYGQGEAAKGRVQRMFADAIKGAVRRGKAGEQRLRNVFSSLGTADSSAFMEAMAGNEQALGADITGLRGEELRNVGEIENYLQRLTQDYQNQVSEIQLNLNTAKNNIMNNQMLSDQQKIYAIQQVQSDAMNNLSDLRLKEQNMRMQIPLQLAGLEAQVLQTLGSGYGDIFNLPQYGTGTMYDGQTSGVVGGIEGTDAGLSPEGTMQMTADGTYIVRNGRWTKVA